MKKKQSQKYFFIYAAGVLVLLSTLIGITFAYFSTSIVGNNTASSINVTTANLGHIIFVDGDSINIGDVYPGWADTKTFTVSNSDSTSELYYAIFLYVETNTLTPVADGAFIYSLSGTSTNSGTTISLNDQVVPYSDDGPANILLSDGGMLNGIDTHTYIFSIEFVETSTNQNAAQGKEFSGALQVNVADGTGERTWDSVNNTWKEYYEITTEDCFEFDSGTITDYYWNELNDEQNPECPMDVGIPEAIAGLTVTAIGDNAFYEKDITGVHFPNTIETIGEEAFEYNALTSLVIPDSVTNIGIWAFSDNSLTRVKMPSSITTISDYAFGWNKLPNVTIPNTVETIGEGAFENNLLSSLSIPDSVTSVGIYAFSGNKLTSVVIPDSMTIISEGLFSDNILTSVTIPDNVVTIGESAFNSNLLSSLVIPDTVTSIGEWAFDTNKLTSITFSSSISTIGAHVFSHNNLTSITIPSWVTSIETYAFAVNDLTSVTIPNTVTSVGQAAFYTNELSSITIPSSVMTIGNYAFSVNKLSNVCIKSKSGTAGFTSYGSTIWGWADGYSDSNITWNCLD